MTSQKHATYCGIATVLCWSTVATAFKLALLTLSPLQLILVASVFSWAFLAIILLVRGQFLSLFSQAPKVYLHSAVFGLLNPLLYYLLLFSAYAQLPAQEAQAINYTWAIVMSILAVPLLGQRMSRSDVLAALLCYFGVLVIATRGQLLTLEFSNVCGVMLAVASTLVWSAYWIFNRKDQREPVLGLCLNFTVTLPLIILLVWLGGELEGLFDRSNWQSLAAGAYVGVFEMGLAFVLWLRAMKLAENTARLANLIFLSPLLSLVWISLFLNEPILVSTLIGLALIIAGLIFQQRFASSDA